MNLQMFLESMNSKVFKNIDLEKTIGTKRGSYISKCYSKNINLLGFLQLEINIVEIGGFRIGVWFCDCTKVKKNFFHQFMYVPSSSELFRREVVGIDEFWFVLIESDVIRESKAVNEFIDKYSLRERYDKVFLYSCFGAAMPNLVMI